MNDVTNFILDKEANQKRILNYLHQLLTVEFGLIDKMKYNIPFYYGRSWVCYLNPIKEDKVELAFTRGNELSNAQGLLQSNGRKQISGVVLESINNMPLQSIKEILHEAIILDETKPYQSKRKSK